ncbi:MAG: hypothetical protein AAF798_00225 [Bacteroidota bacterium]
MEFTTIFHYFEVKHQTVLDYPQAIRSALKPFLASTSFTITNENTLKQRIDLNSSSDYYKIISLHDRTVFRCEESLESLLSPSALVGELFFDLISKLIEAQAIGKPLHVLHYSIVLKKVDCSSELEVANKIRERYFTPELDKLSSDYTSFHIDITEKKYDEGHISAYRIGPFNYRDIIEANGYEVMRESSLLEIRESFFEYLEIKLFNDIQSTSLNFSYYKKLTQQAIDKANEVWKI